MGGSAPKADPNIGIAALKSAQTGEQMLGWMQDQAKITNAWAAEDRSRYKDKFLPLQDSLIAEATAYDSPQMREKRATEAMADVNQGIANQTGARNRQAMAMGVDPSSGRFMAASGRAATDGALAEAGGANMARRAVEGEGRALKANAVNMGMGLGVNPATSMGLSNGAISSGGSAAMAGYGQQGNLLNTQYQQQMQAWQANQGALGALGGAFGKIIGTLPMFASSKDIKTDKQPVDALGAVRKIPVEKWTYMPGQGDEGRHVGPYAEDFAKATGLGDGKSISMIDMMGLTLGAVRDLDEKVSNMSKAPSGRKAAA